VICTFLEGTQKVSSFWIFLKLERLSTLIVTLKRWPSLMPGLPESNQKRRKRFLLQHGNARPHTSVNTTVKVTKFGRRVLPHPPVLIFTIRFLLAKVFEKWLTCATFLRKQSGHRCWRQVVRGGDRLSHLE